jgi:NAD(P)-dependent dehydrogenase (short-subunit alcohol dehydrogenase family)
VNLRGNVALVTGGASGLGEAVAHRLAASGARVAVLDLDEAKGCAVAEAVGGRFVRADVSSEVDVIAAIESTRADGPLRALVTAAGISVPMRTIGRDGTFASAHTLSLFERVLRVNVIGTFNCVRLAASAMSTLDPVDDDGQRGAIVTLSSAAAFDGQIGQAAYSTSKGGIVGMTLPVARDLAVVGIRVNCVAPGLFDTPIYGEGPEAEQFKETLRRDVLFPRRLGRATELASLVHELLTNDYLNAEVVRADAGVRLPPK